jgi:hypothetical protein
VPKMISSSRYSVGRSFQNIAMYGNYMGALLQTRKMLKTRPQIDAAADPAVNRSTSPNFRCSKIVMRP